MIGQPVDAMSSPDFGIASGAMIGAGHNKTQARTTCVVACFSCCSCQRKRTCFLKFLEVGAIPCHGVVEELDTCHPLCRGIGMSVELADVTG
jgi:hypothetical protein